MDLLNPREPVSTWSHGMWLLLALWGLVLLWQTSREDRARKITLLIYGLSLVFCAGSSTLYHGLRLPGKRINAFALMDHVSIYMLIAGTYTPIAWTFLSRHWRRCVLGLVWFWAALGITIQLTCEPLPSWLSTGYYLAMGWGALFCYSEVARRLSHRAMLPIVVGGVLYSVGALFNLLHRPVLWPGVIQSHELFHFFVVAASLLHFYYILTVVGPPIAAPEFEPVG
jgi:hemolysin III